MSVEIIRRTIEVNGIPCELVNPRGSKKRAEQAILHCVTNVHSENQVREAMAEAVSHAVALKIEWTEGKTSRDGIGTRWQNGDVDGINWTCDWSSGCSVTIQGQEWNRDQESEAIGKVRSFFVNRLKTEPDVVDVRRCSCGNR